MKKSHTAKWLTALVSVIALAAASPARALPPQPTYGTASVDGLTNEWNLVTDFFADMHRAGRADKPIESKLYLRYNCLTETMYVLVLTVDGVPALAYDPATAWIALDNQSNKVVHGTDGDDGTPPDFAWVGLGYDADPTHAQGYEASFHVEEGKYEIIVHVNVFDADNQQTSATIGFPNSGPNLEIICGVVPVTPTTWSQIKFRQR